ncbi:hypothetical protein ACX0FG_16220, partial [Enterococcus faecium]
MRAGRVRAGGVCEGVGVQSQNAVIFVRTSAIRLIGGQNGGSKLTKRHWRWHPCYRVYLWPRGSW